MFHVKPRGPGVPRETTKGFDLSASTLGAEALSARTADARARRGRGSEVAPGCGRRPDPRATKPVKSQVGGHRQLSAGRKGAGHAVNLANRTAAVTPQRTTDWSRVKRVVAPLPAEWEAVRLAANPRVDAFRVALRTVDLAIRIRSASASSKVFPPPTSAASIAAVPDIRCGVRARRHLPP